jgi:hypothetical protein
MMTLLVGGELSAEGWSNRVQFLQAWGVERYVIARQAHGTNVRVVEDEDAGQTFECIDAFVTSRPTLALTVTVADCFPVFVWDAAEHAIGLAHAGWRGAAGGVVPALIRELRQRLGARAAALRAAIGPGIRACHFSVQADVAAQFAAYPFAVTTRAERTFVDLPAVITAQLRAVGVPSEQVSDARECTACLPERYFSYRRDQPAAAETMLAYVVRLA